MSEPKATAPGRPTVDDLVSKAGQVWSRYSDPVQPTTELIVPPPPAQARDALAALRLQAELLGYLGKGMDEESFRAELDRLGLEIVPKGTREKVKRVK